MKEITYSEYAGTSLKKVRNPNYYRHIFDESERSSCHFPLLNINMKFHFDLEELNTQDPRARTI